MFTESNVVEAMIRDLLCGTQPAAAKVVADLPAPYIPAGLARRGAGWHYAAAAALPRQPQDVFVESFVREALIRLNPDIAAQPERADEVLYKLRAIVLADPMDALTEALLIFAARRDHLRLVIEPALARGEVVICDRFTDATFAYQGGGRGFDLATLATLEQWVQRIENQPDGRVRQPALTLWFDLAPEVAAARLAGVRVPDKFEAQPAAFFDAVRAGYARRGAESPGRFAHIDADQPREAVWADVHAAVQGRGWL